MSTDVGDDGEAGRAMSRALDGRAAQHEPVRDPLPRPVLKRTKQTPEELAQLRQRVAEMQRRAVDSASKAPKPLIQQKATLREALRYLRDQLDAHFYAHVTILGAQCGFVFPATRATDALLELLLELEALDLIGLAKLIETGESKKIHRARLNRRRKQRG